MNSFSAAGSSLAAVGSQSVGNNGTGTGTSGGGSGSGSGSGSGGGSGSMSPVNAPGMPVTANNSTNSNSSSSGSGTNTTSYVVTNSLNAAVSSMGRLHNMIFQCRPANVLDFAAKFFEDERCGSNLQYISGVCAPSSSSAGAGAGVLTATSTMLPPIRSTMLEGSASTGGSGSGKDAGHGSGSGLFNIDSFAVNATTATPYAPSGPMLYPSAVVGVGGGGGGGSGCGTPQSASSPMVGGGAGGFNGLMSPAAGAGGGMGGWASPGAGAAAQAQAQASSIALYHCLRSVPYLLQQPAEFKSAVCTIFCHPDVLQVAGVPTSSGGDFGAGKASGKGGSGGAGASSLPRMDIVRLCNQAAFPVADKITVLVVFEVFRKLNIPYGLSADFSEFLSTFRLVVFTICALRWTERLFADVVLSSPDGGGRAGSRKESAEFVEVAHLLQHLRRANRGQCGADYGRDMSVATSAEMFELVQQALVSIRTQQAEQAAARSDGGSGSGTDGGGGGVQTKTSVRLVVVELLQQQMRGAGVS